MILLILNKGFYIEKQIERAVVKPQIFEEPPLEHRRRVLVRNHSDFTQTQNQSDSENDNIKDEYFERYFGFKPGEKVDLKKHMEIVNQKKQQLAQQKYIMKHRGPEGLTYEEKIAYRMHKNPSIKPPVYSKNALKPILKQQDKSHRDFGRVVKNKILGIDQNERYDFSKLGNAHIYGHQQKLIDDSNIDNANQEVDNELKLPAFYKQTINVPKTIVKSVNDHLSRYKSRNDKMKEKNRTLNFTIKDDDLADNTYNKYVKRIQRQGMGLKNCIHLHKQVFICKFIVFLV